MNKEALAILSMPSIQAFIRERMGVIQKRDSLIYLGESCFVSETIHPSYYRLQFESYQACNNHEKIFVDEKAIRIPRSIDDERPERGLAELVAGVVTIGKQLFIKDSYFVSIRITDKDGNYKKFISFKGDTPLLALLRALEAQIEGGKG